MLVGAGSNEKTSPLPRVIFVVGQTAVGKTAQAIALAQAIGGEIISADSRQIYRYMDIGTAKPSRVEQQQVPHHLVDVVDPDTPLTLAEYRDRALALIADIVRRGRVPLVVGGTGQYAAALLEGWSIPEIPPNPHLRAQLEALAPAELAAQLVALDPAAAATIHVSNVRRMVRALEVCISTGQRFSELRQAQALTFTPDVYWLTLETATLYQRIDARVDAMLASGLAAEVEMLLARGYAWSLPAMSGIGYREFQPWYAGESDLVAVVERIKFNTHAFARRQATWFRRFAAQQVDVSQTTLCERCGIG